VYINERALTFADLSKAVQASAGLGQVTLDFPFGTPTDSGDTFNPNDPTYAAQSAASLPPGSVAPLTAAQSTFLQTGSTFSAPWGTLALCVGGLFLFSMVIGKK
jgi:hypothetical protein